MKRTQIHGIIPHFVQSGHSQSLLGYAHGNLLKLGDNFTKFVVSMDEVNMSRKGIIHLNIKDFLLNDW